MKVIAANTRITICFLLVVDSVVTAIVGSYYLGIVTKKTSSESANSYVAIY